MRRGEEERRATGVGYGVDQLLRLRKEHLVLAPPSARTAAQWTVEKVGANRREHREAYDSDA